MKTGSGIHLIRDIPAAVLLRKSHLNAVVPICRPAAGRTHATARLISPRRTKIGYPVRGVRNLWKTGWKPADAYPGARNLSVLNSSLEYGVLTITMDNSFDGQARQEDGKFLSSKRMGAPRRGPQLHPGRCQVPPGGCPVRGEREPLFYPRYIADYRRNIRVTRFVVSHNVFW